MKQSKTRKKTCVFLNRAVHFTALVVAAGLLTGLFTGCPNNAGGGTQSGPDPNLKIEGTVVKGYKGEKPTGVLNIPAGITEIASFAFSGCAGLTQVNFPSSLEKIGYSAFSRCTGLTGTLSLPVSLKKIDSDAFEGCTQITEVKLPSSLEPISGDVFNGCTKLTSFTMASEGTYIQVIDNIIYSKDKKKLLCSIPKPASPSLTLFEGLEEIAASAFSGCTTLTQVNFPSSLKKIDSFAFSYCTGLTGLTLPSNLEEIGYSAFSRCTGLTGTLSLPVSLQTISGSAFNGCTNLEHLTMASVGTHLLVEADIVYSKDKKKLLCSIPKPASPSLTLSEGLEEIAASAFSGCTSLTGVTFPASLKIIGSNAFQDCTGLTGLTLPSSSNLEAIDSFAFSGCRELTGTVTFPASLKTIGSYAFSRCKNVSNFDFSSCTTPPLDSIGNGAFPGCTAATYKVKSGSGVKEKLTSSGVAVGQITEVP